MENTDNRKHLSLLEAVPSEGEGLKGKSRRAKENAIEAKVGRSIAADNADSEEASSRSRQVDSAASLLGTPGEQERREQAQTGALLRSESTGKVSAAPTFELPRRRNRRPLGGLVSFILCVLLPTTLAAVYYFGYASNQYVVQFKFTVRDTNTSVSTSAATASLSASIGMPTSPNPTENYMVAEYMKSRQAVEDLQTRINIRQLYSHPFIDFWARLDASEPMERFTKYWKDVATAEYDQITGISAAEVRAFTPDDAYLIANTLIASTDDMINEVSQRPLREAVRYAEAEVKRAEDRLRQIRADLAAYREKEGVIEPIGSVVLANATVASTIRGLLAQLQTDMANLKKQGLSANAPPVQGLQTRIRATEEQLKEIEGEVSRKSGGNSAISPVVARYEQLDLERQFAQNILNSTMQSWEQARANAITKRLYVISFVSPAKPQTSTYPNRFVATLTAAGACLMLWTIALLVSRSIKEHLT